MGTADPALSLQQAEEILSRLAANMIQALRPTVLVVGLSGGPDSTLLLAVCKAVCQQDPRFELRAVHCIHGLDADDPIWLNHCRQLCESLQVPLTIKKLHIVYKNRESPEDSSRQERYRALLEELHGGVLCLGHQADDNVENLFLALKRGSGPHGLAGMNFITRDARGTIVRPLLTLPRAQVEAMTAALGLPTVFDISNTYLKFERNFFRLQVLPLILTRFPSFKQAAARSQQLCALEHDLAERFIEPHFVQRFNAAQNSLDFTGLDLTDEHLCLMLLRRFCHSALALPPELNLLKAALQLMRGEHGAVGCIVLHGTQQLRRFRHKLYLMSPYREPAAALSPQQLSQGCTLALGQQLQLGDVTYRLSSLSQAEAAAHAGQCFSLSDGTVRLAFKPAGAQKMKPQGRQHSRELKKLYTEYGIPSWLRPCLPLVYSCSGELLALGGVFACQGAEHAASCCLLEVYLQGRQLDFGTRGQA